MDSAQLQQIRQKHAELQRLGRIPSDQSLQEKFALIRERFGPEVLRGLSGTPLLQLLHGNGRDSLAYWLEFKSDEEFDTRSFGSISGGSALKFRLFQRKATGKWQAANKGNYPTDIPLEQAIEMAEAHRQQLLAASAPVADLSEGAGDREYGNLQAEIERRAPDIYQLGWVHKYLYLNYPTKLDDYHAQRWQRFHLIKLLELPPASEGLYANSGRFVSGAKTCGLPIAVFSKLLNELHGDPYRYWRVGTSDSAGESHWEMMQRESRVGIGWAELGDLSWVQATRESRKKLQELAEKTYSNDPSEIETACSDLTNFIARAQDGDVVLAADGQAVLGVGRLRGPYEFRKGSRFAHQRRVEWLSMDEWQLPSPKEGLRSKFCEIKKHSENLLAIEQRLQGSRPKGPTVTGGNAPVALVGIPGRIQSILDRKRQVILYGPPGTGKTFHAERTARDLASLSAFSRRFDELEDSDATVVIGTPERPGLVRLCCFHPGYGYEDFLEGYRPHTVNGQVAFELRDGVFKKLCKDAVEAPQRQHFLVIDEINRGDIPRIFGELLTILEKDKRGKHVVLPVSQQSFSIPDNVFVIGTMNTADRSISLLDAALRRRFGFVELMPDSTLLKQATIGECSLQAWFEVLNSRIREHVGRDARNLQIGHSYLLQGGVPLKDAVAFKRVLRDDIIPLLEEYCYEQFDTLAHLLGKGLVDPENKCIRDEIFEDGQEDQLLKTVWSAYEEIASSDAAIEAEEAADIADDDSEDEEE